MTEPLITVRPGVTLRASAAASFRRVEKEKGSPLSVNRTTESAEAQMKARRAWLAYQNGTGPEAPYALDPTESHHVAREDGTGGDAWDTDERGDWLDRHGWIADVKGEGWHREYRWWRDQYRNTPAPASTTTTTQEEEEPMRYLLQLDTATDGRWFLIDFAEGTAQRVHNHIQLELIRRDPRVDAVVGPQPLAVLAGLAVAGE